MRSLSQFAEQPYLNLELYGRSHVVQAPVWFVEDGGVLYALTTFGSDPTRWLHPAPRVRVAPAGQDGELHGEWLEARARLAWEAEAARARKLLAQKYGRLREAWLGLCSRLRHRAAVVIAIHL